MKLRNLIPIGVFLALAASVGLPLRADEPASTLDAAVARAEQDRIAAVNKAVPSVLAIMAAGGQGGGSGVVITPDGYALTNFHVSKPCGNFMKCGMADGKLYDAVIVGIDPVGDVALIKLFADQPLPVAEIADSDQVRVGDWCFAMGNPLLLANDFYPSVSYGLVSGVHRYQYGAGTLLEYTDCLQVDAAINPGNSGGPLFDARGRLIGINGRGSFEKRGRVNVGVGYAISINQIKNFMGHLRGGWIVDHATLGASASTADDGRVLVSDILDDSDAARRGLRYDDEIVSLAGRTITTANELKNILGIFPKGWRLPLEYRRDGETHSIYVRLMGVHSEAELIAKTEGRTPGSPEEDPNQPPEKRRPQPDDPEKKPERPANPLHGLKPEAKVPENVKQQFEARTGFANYYFNRENAQRVWKAIASSGDFSSLDAPWVISGQPMTSGKVVLRLADDECEIELPTGDTKVVIAEGLDSMLNPPGSGGMLSALYLWRKLLLGGPGKFGQVTYAGTAPLPDRSGLYDVLLGVAGGVEARFYCDASAGELACIEMFPDEWADPCEVYFDDYREVEGRMLPHRMEVRYGDSVFGVFNFDTFDLQPVGD